MSSDLPSTPNPVLLKLTVRSCLMRSWVQNKASIAEMKLTRSWLAEDSQNLTVTMNLWLKMIAHYSPQTADFPPKSSFVPPKTYLKRLVLNSNNLPRSFARAATCTSCYSSSILLYRKYPTPERTATISSSSPRCSLTWWLTACLLVLLNLPRSSTDQLSTCESALFYTKYVQIQKRAIVRQDSDPFVLRTTLMGARRMGQLMFLNPTSVFSCLLSATNLSNWSHNPCQV